MTGSVTQWIRMLQAGDSAGAQPLWERYFSQLVRLCERRLHGRRPGKIDGEDLASVVLTAFIRGTLTRQFPLLDDRDDLWKLLLTITARRVANALRDAGRRPAVQENVLAGPEGDGFQIDMVIGEEPSPEEVGMLLDTLGQLEAAAPEQKLRQVAELKMQGYRSREIAEKLGCAEPTVQRKLRRIRDFLQRLEG